MRRDQAIVHLVAVYAIAAIACSTADQCRCLDPHAACWPTQNEWDDFNVTVGGRLLAPKPTGSPCHDPNYNASLCQYIRDNYFDSYLRRDNAGSMQSENWEDEGQKTCSMNAPQRSVCHQGQVPLLGVQVEVVGDVQKAIKFAARYNLRVVVKSSGHDYQGRSTAAGSFLIWMHKLNNITIHESFVPSGGCGKQSTPALRIDGGVPWGDVYDTLKPTGYIIVGGMCRTVSATGGYVQGGGHGVLGPSFGLAVDSVLEFEVVTADGKFQTTNACNDPELFFALRGGGGGTYGVVTSITYKLHKTPSNLAGVFLSFNPPNGTLWTLETQEEILTVFSREAVALDAAKWGGYWIFNSQSFFAVFLAPSTQAAVDEAIAPLIQDLIQMENVKSTLNYSFNVSSFQDWHRALFGILYPKTYTTYVGDRVLLGSRITPLSALKNPRRLAQTLLGAMAVSGNSPSLLGLMVIGPGVRTADPAGLTSVTPAWRKGIWDISQNRVWEWNATAAEKRSVRNNLKAFVTSLQKAFRNSGAYANEACIDEPQWQRSFWGLPNYARLLATKLRVDPHGLFVCHHCVGSEFWDDAGNCRRDSR